jgi:hypothetical protein
MWFIDSTNGKGAIVPVALYCPLTGSRNGHMEKGMSYNKDPAEIAICMGSSCYARGNKRHLRIVKKYIEYHGLCGKVVLKGHLCEGLCQDGPNITLDDQVFNINDPDFLEYVLDQYLISREPS